MATRSARRSPPRRTTNTDTKKRGRGTFVGSAGRERYKRELEKQERRRAEAAAKGGQPFRFRMKVGETRELVILDEEPSFFRYEHNLQDERGYWSVFTGCVRETDVCPICRHYKKESSYVMYLTVLDLTPYETKGGETVEFSRKLMPVKMGMQRKFIRWWERHGSMRGQVIEMVRDTSQDASIGSDLEWVDVMEEDELAEYQREWKDREGKTHTEDCSVPYDYLELFEEPDTESLIKILEDKGIKVEDVPGSVGANRRALEEDEDGDDVPWDEEEEGKTRRSSRRSSASKRKSTGRVRRTKEDVEDEEESEEEERPVRRSRRVKDEEEEEERPVRRSRRSKDVEDEDEEEEEKPSRATRVRVRRGR